MTRRNTTFSFKGNYLVLTLLLFIVHQMGYQVKRGTINDPNLSDEQIDKILWSFFEDWEAEGVFDGKEFNGILKKIGELFVGVDSAVDLAFRCRRRLKLIMEALAEKHPPRGKREL